MQLRRILPLALVVALIAALCFGQPVATTWYSFNKQFITANYPQDSASGSLTVNGWRAAQTIHGRSCGGYDGELHIGVTLQGIQLAADQMPLSAPLNELDPGWGIVMELPNAAKGNGKTLLSQNANQPATFTGYFRIWDEGHAVTAVHPSNPHHIFEIHPAWAFRAGTATFNRPDLIDSIADYRGFGATKFMPIINALNDGAWPRAYQDQNSLHVELLRSGNFFQLPIHIREVQELQGGHAVIVDVYSDRNFNNLRYEGLRCITITGSPVDSQLEVDTTDFWLGIFSVNLRTALEGSTIATSEDTAAVVPNAVKFFVFGPALRRAIVSCQ